MKKDVHANSLAAYREGRLEVFAQRDRDCLRALERLGVASDRDVMAYLGHAEPNAVRPRLTELIDKGVVEECGTMTDPLTGRTVRRVRIVRVPVAATEVAQTACVLAQGELL